MTGKLAPITELWLPQCMRPDPLTFLSPFFSSAALALFFSWFLPKNVPRSISKCRGDKKCRRKVLLFSFQERRANQRREEGRKIGKWQKRKTWQKNSGNIIKGKHCSSNSLSFHFLLLCLSEQDWLFFPDLFAFSCVSKLGSSFRRNKKEWRLHWCHFTQE